MNIGWMQLWLDVWDQEASCLDTVYNYRKMCCYSSTSANLKFSSLLPNVDATTLPVKIVMSLSAGVLWSARTERVGWHENWSRGSNCQRHNRENTKSIHDERTICGDQKWTESCWYEFKNLNPNYSNDDAVEPQQQSELCRLGRESSGTEKSGEEISIKISLTVKMTQIGTRMIYKSLDSSDKLLLI